MAEAREGPDCSPPASRLRDRYNALSSHLRLSGSGLTTKFKPVMWSEKINCTVLIFCVSIWMWYMHMYVSACIWKQGYDCGCRRQHGMSHPISLCFTPLRWNRSLNLQLNWWPANPSNSPASVPTLVRTQPHLASYLSTGIHAQDHMAVRQASYAPVHLSTHVSSLTDKTIQRFSRQWRPGGDPPVFGSF